MAQEQEYLSPEQVLQELQIDRSELDRLISEGLLTERLIGGEPRFSSSEVLQIKGAPQGGPGAEPQGGRSERADHETELLTDDEDELELEAPAAEPPLAGETVAGEGPGPAAVSAEASKEEDFFDFSAGLEEEQLELEESAPASGAAEGPAETIDDLLDVGAEAEVPEAELLSEIMEISEEGEPAGVEMTEDITAEITTLEEPTYEESGLEEVLEAEEEVEFGAEGEDFDVPYAAPVTVAEAQVGALPVVLLVLTLIVMLFAGLFVAENAFRPEFSTHLTGWVPGAPKSP